MDFDPGYGHEPFATLVAAAPGATVYRRDRFRTEWGPIFHRGRLDGSARVLVIGQDPAAHETIARRVLCGHAGHRVQGFLAKAGVTDSYVIVNVFLYALYDLDALTISPAMQAERFRWIDAIRDTSPIEVVITFGSVAATLWASYLADREPDPAPVHARALHPSARLPEATHLANWRAALATVRAGLVTPDRPPRGTYGDAFTDADVADIPAADLPPGLPAWMRSAETWAVRGDGHDDAPKASRMTVTVPAAHRVDR
jgi:uracil-DNA glycosylase